jgi:hypothetical protein
MISVKDFPHATKTVSERLVFKITNSLHSYERLNLLIFSMKPNLIKELAVIYTP